MLRGWRAKRAEGEVDETALKEISRCWKMAPEGEGPALRDYEEARRGSAALVRENGYTVTEVAAYLRRNPANVSYEVDQHFRYS